MSDTVIKIDHLSKRYRIGENHGGRFRYQSLRDALTKSFLRLSSRFNRPYRLSKGHHQTQDVLWALKDVSFEVKKGEVIGIIGRNGAGKSTFLKILCRITEPTEGFVDLHGRVGALLEVGTGFHPELTGRENIYLNAAILGMKKREIDRKFDEIVAFAEIEKFIDTPVKHYSSGMYVRLAFAVAAHLDPEILLVDETLAVGDAAFQKKCLGKMSNVAHQGRTVLFVSHSMGAVSGLCTRAILLNQGKIETQGPANEVIRQYLRSVERQQTIPLRDRRDRVGDGRARLTAVSFFNERLEPIQFAASGQELMIALHYESTNHRSIDKLCFEIGVYNLFGELIFLCGSDFARGELNQLPPRGRVLCRIPHLPLSPGLYDLNVYCGLVGNHADWVKSAAKLQVVDGDFFGTGRFPANYAGIVDRKSVV